jgi:hypothetical protein
MEKSRLKTKDFCKIANVILENGLFFAHPKDVQRKLRAAGLSKRQASLFNILSVRDCLLDLESKHILNPQKEKYFERIAKIPARVHRAWESWHRHVPIIRTCR